MIANNDWLSLPDAAAVLKCTPRHAHRLLRAAAASAPGTVRSEASGQGRPRRLYHRSLITALSATALAPSGATGDHCLVPHSSRSDGGSPIHPSDLTIAQFRQEAVHLYIESCRLLSESEAVRNAIAKFSAKPRRRDITIEERLGRDTRKVNVVVQLGAFSPGTLRRWTTIYLKSGKSLLSLAPQRKGRSGRHQEQIPEPLLNLVHAWSVKNPRADLRKALVAARREWPGDWPAVSYSTWCDRIRRRDPAGVCKTLGKRGIAEFRREHSTDINRDYTEMEYNELWELDDITLDFYGYSWDLNRLTRPYAYAIIRCSTRQWVAVMTCETPITKDQVRALVGVGLASPIGGIPNAIRFENGEIACDANLEEDLLTIGVKVKRTSMDGGRVNSIAAEDRAKGHFQGKGVVESNIRNMHNVMWDESLQVGTNERAASHANLETAKREITALAKAGKIITRLTPQQWQGRVFDAFNRFNDRPHGSLPEFLDPGAGDIRHMSPNEFAKTKTGDTKVLDQRILQLFLTRAVRVPVNKNGFILNNFGYGKFDEDLQKIAGQSVLVFACKDCPQVAYVHELGRVVDYWRAPKAGEESLYMEPKRRIEAHKRNQYETMTAAALAQGSRAVIDQTRMMADATPSRPRVIVSSEAALQKAERLTSGINTYVRKQKERAARFNVNTASTIPISGNRDMNAGAAPVLSRRQSFLERAEEMSEEVAMLSNLKPMKEEAYQ